MPNLSTISTGLTTLPRDLDILPSLIIHQPWANIVSGIPSLKPIVLQNLQAIEDEKGLDNIASVALFVIDESHNLRKTTGTRYEALLEWIRKNKKAHVLLLTATPINNELQDLTNQILLGMKC